MTKIMEKPIPSLIIFGIIFLLVFGIFSSIFGGIFKGILSSIDGRYIGLIIGAIIAAFIYIYISKIKGFFSFSNSKLAFVLILPAVLFIIQTLLDPTFSIPTTDKILFAIVMGLAPGISEEIMFRGFLVSHLIRFFRSSKSIYSIVIFSALLFGLVHISNSIFGAPLDMSIFQAFYAFALGVLFVCVYLRTGNIWLPIIIHSIIDFLSSFCGNTTQDLILTTHFVLDFSSIFIIVISIICIVLGFYYVRSSKHDDILAVWDEKWIN